MQYNVLIEAFCETYGLGKVREARLLPTGVANRTYIVETELDKYVIKAINPSRIRTAADLARIEITEQIAELANENGIPSISAKRLNGKIVNELNEQHYIVFDFFEGKVIRFKKITPENCFKMGGLLADLHQIDFEKKVDLNLDDLLRKHGVGGHVAFQIDWQYYFEKASLEKPKWLGIFEANLADLYKAIEVTLPSYLSFIPQDTLISHADLFSHNVLWKEDEPYIIDWERSGFIDATYDCLHTAIRWATKTPVAENENPLQIERLYAFLNGYTQKRSLNVENVAICLHIILYNRLNHLKNHLAKYFNSKDEVSKKQAEKVIKYSLFIVGSYKNLVIDQLEELQQFLMSNQSNYNDEKSPSYILIPKMKQLLIHHRSINESQRITYEKKISRLNAELAHVTKWAIGLRIYRKIKSIFKKNRK